MWLICCLKFKKYICNAVYGLFSCMPFHQLNPGLIKNNDVFYQCGHHFGDAPFLVNTETT